MQFGVPKILHSDNGGEFVNEIINELSRVFGFRLAHGKAYNPREQGKVERMNRTLSVSLSKLMYSRQTRRWIDLIDECCYSYRITKCTATGKTPIEVVFYTTTKFYL